MYPDHEFDPITPEEEAQRAQEAEFARRVRREVLRIERGEAEEEIRADLEREAEEKAEAEERERRERRRKASTFWQLFSGTTRASNAKSRSCANGRSACRSSVTAVRPTRPSSSGCANAASTSMTPPPRAKSSKIKRR